MNNKQRLINIPSSVARFFVYFIGFMLIGIAAATHKYFGNTTLDQALTTILFDLRGAVSGDTVFLRRFLVWCIYAPLALSLLALLIKPLWRLLSFFIPKPLRHHPQFIILILGIILFGYQFQIPNYLRLRIYPPQDYFANNYVKPDAQLLKVAKPKNLVLIYVESLENTYSDHALFHDDLLHKLTQLKSKHISFREYQQMPGTDWSIAGIVATQCAIPLKLITLFGGNTFGQQATKIVPGAVCLSDILAEHGYQNIYMNGSDLDFAGVGKFFKDHHYQELYGREEWRQQGLLTDANTTGWGLSDDMLLQQAKLKLNTLMRAGKPFNLTLFTIDTHGYGGQLTPACKAQGYYNFEGIVACTANHVADFVNYVDQQGWLDKITIVIIGDHLAMKNAVYERLTKKQHRTIFNMIVSKNPGIKNTETITHFDILPTVLTSLGFNIPNGKLGLGYSGIGHAAARPTYRLAEMQEKIIFPSQAYNELWK